MIRWLYEKNLLRGLALLPEHICFMITAEEMTRDPEKLLEVTRWCRDISHAIRQKGESNAAGDAWLPTRIEGVAFHISTPDPEHLVPFLPYFRRVREIARLSLHIGDLHETMGEGMDVWIAVGKSGREEIAECIRCMGREGISPAQVNEQAIEEHLTFRCNPDLVIKTGGSHLTDFLIWQSVYSELFFSDVNWSFFRRIDLLRALRDYQSRARRFGK
jgi:undecaprenyl diphosphate synthase